MLRAFCFWIWVIMGQPIAAEPIMGIAFPPVSNAAQRAFTIETLGALGVRHIRIEESWARRPLHPTARDFAPLVRRIEQLRAGGLSILLTISSDAPVGACANADKQDCAIGPDAPFDAYMTQVLNAVGSDLDAIQFANEIDNDFPLSSQEFLDLHARFAQVVRRHSPNMPIVLAGLTGAVPYTLAACRDGINPQLGPAVNWEDVKETVCADLLRHAPQKTQIVSAALLQADYDIADIHLYDAPGLWPASIRWLTGKTNGRPIWVTEFGGPNPQLEPKDEVYHAAQLKRYLEAISRLPIQRAYYFKLTDDRESYHATSGLFTRRLDAKPALQTFRDSLKR